MIRGIWIRRKRGLAAAALCLALAVGLAASPPAAAFELTPAQALLFDSNHLGGVDGGTTLHYRFEKAGSLEPGFTDTVEMTVERDAGDGRKDVSFHFLTGDHAIPFEPMSRFRGNPLIMLFLERDVREMKRLTGGSELYFRNRLRDGFAAATATVTPTTIRWNGATAPATEVVIHPFVAVPLIERFARFEHKEYRFVLSDAVPGALYAARAVTPGDASPILDESLVLAPPQRAALSRTEPRP